MKSTQVGTVVRAKMPKMVTVVVKRQRRHPIYGKIVRIKTRIHAHDTLGAHEGQTVRLQETRPLSKLKRFTLVEIIGKKEEKR